METIRHFRKGKGWTQEQLANAIGVKRAIISKYESGMVSPSYNMVQKIAAALDIPVTELVGDEGRIITEKMLDEEVERVFFYKLDDYLADMTTAEKDLLFRLYLAQAEEMSRYSKEHKKTPPEAQEGAPEGE